MTELMLIETSLK